jgi:phospholipid/cholesterol/gamma-HCH transport system substrate-binding protein
VEPKVNYVLVGLFVVILGSATLGVVVWLGKGDYRADYTRYYAFMRESVAGLSTNAPVKYHGVEVGYVAEIVLNPDNPEEVRLTLDMTRGTPIKEDTVATLYVQGLTGFAVIDLDGGSRASSLLTAKPGERYPVIQTRPSFFVRIEETSTRLITNMNQLLEDTRRLIDADTRAAFKRMLVDLAQLTHTLATQSPRLDEGVVSAAEASHNLARLTQSLNEQLPALVEAVHTSTVALKEMTRDVSLASQSVRETFDRTRPGIEQFTRQTLAETSLLLSELRQLTESLNRVAQQLESQPESLIFGRPSPPLGPGE